MHYGYRFYDILSAHAFTGLIYNSRYGAPGRYPDFPLSLHKTSNIKKALTGKQAPNQFIDKRLCFSP
jgi:hypothetical protein